MEQNVKLTDEELALMLGSVQKPKSTTVKKLSKEEKRAKSFYPKLASETIRIMPHKIGEPYYTSAYFHIVDLHTSKGLKKGANVIYCPAHNNPPKPKLDLEGKVVLDANGKTIMEKDRCPLCEKAEKKMKSQLDNSAIRGKKESDLTPEGLEIFRKNKEIYKEAKKFEAVKHYFVKVIDRGSQKDGVKIWRFKEGYSSKNPKTGEVISSGTFEKLERDLSSFLNKKRMNYSDPQNGVDFEIISMKKVNQLKGNGETYIEVSTFVPQEPSPLHKDSVVVDQWVNDKISWRDLFPPQEAPNLSPYEYLLMVAEGANPYWDDTNPNDKHWVFPGRPDLEAKARTRTQNLEPETNSESNFKYASDVNNESHVTISNVTKENVGTYKDNSIDLGKTVTTEYKNEFEDANVEPNIDDVNFDDDLPF